MDLWYLSTSLGVREQLRRVRGGGRDSGEDCARRIQGGRRNFNKALCFIGTNTSQIHNQPMQSTIICINHPTKYLILLYEKMYTNLVRDLIHGYTSDVEKGRVLFRSVG